MKKFKLGQTVVTRAINERMKEDSGFQDFVKKSLSRYINRDWGDTCPEDARANDEAVREGERVLAVYIYKGETIWIITEWDRSVTTILFPSDY